MHQHAVSVPVSSWCCASESERRAGLSVTGRRSRESLPAARHGKSDMASVQKIKLSPSRDIPFNKLVLSQSNVRRVKAGVSIEQLAESIAQRNLFRIMRDRLRAFGIFAKIILWKLCFFVPVDATGPAILAKVLECYRMVRVADRAAL
jgi:hypothetical protein